MNKQELLDTLRTERAAFDALLTQVSEERMTIPGVVGDWSVKDIVAHLTAWEGRPVEWFAAARKNVKPKPAPWPSDLTEEQINAWIVETNKNRSLSDVLAESRAVSDQVLQSVEEFSEEDLNDRQKFSWLNGNAFVDSISGNTYEHYHEHGEFIRAWLKAKT